MNPFLFDLLGKYSLADCGHTVVSIQFVVFLKNHSIACLYLQLAPSKDVCRPGSVSARQANFLPADW